MAKKLEAATLGNTKKRNTSNIDIASAFAERKGDEMRLNLVVIGENY